VNRTEGSRDPNGQGHISPQGREPGEIHLPEGGKGIATRDGEGEEEVSLNQRQASKNGGVVSESRNGDEVLATPP